MRNLLLPFILTASTGAVTIAASPPGAPAVQSGAAADSLERALALHVLNRLTYGPRPGDVDRVVAMGIDRYIEQQLNPETIDDRVLSDHLRRYQILGTTARELATLDREARRERVARRRADSTASPGARDMPGEAGQRRRRMLGEFQQVAVVRAVMSERQLYEVMVDFWTNHFNVFLGKGAVRFLAPEYIEHTIRPHALGSFRDLLIATAQSPAMLVYLDNATSVAPDAEPPQLAAAERAVRRMRAGRRGGGERLQRMEQRLEQARERMPTGINENYARELLELHTLGVDGGYSQSDVENVARILTGWGTGRLARGETDFEFHAWAHDREGKVVMGQTYPAGGDIDEGLRLLEFLAMHPVTMRHVGGKLCERFVNDDPPPGCVDRAVAAWERSEGDLREVVRAVLTSADFRAPAHWGSKTKTPLEFVVSAVRALGASPDGSLALAQVVRRLGQPLYGHEAPTGYPEVQEEWINAGALLERLNVALGFAAGRVPGVDFNVTAIGPTSDRNALVAAVGTHILNGTASASTLGVIAEQVEQARSGVEARIVAVGFALGSPEFQRQ